jgi:hypothetical protein
VDSKAAGVEIKEKFVVVNISSDCFSIPRSTTKNLMHQDDKAIDNMATKAVSDIKYRTNTIPTDAAVLKPRGVRIIDPITRKWNDY